MKKLMVSLVLTLTLVSSAAVAQTSASYQLDEHVFNSGGVPSDGIQVSSASYTLSLVAIGESVGGGSSPASASYGVSSGFPSAYPAPGEVLGLAFEDSQTLAWNTEHSAGSYNLYRDLLSSISGLGYGSCEQQDIAGSTTNDASIPPQGDGYFYLVTVENRLAEEGTKGSASDASERVGGVCP